MIRQVYQKLSRGKPAVCRFSPSCSEYAAQAFARYGFLRGLLMSLRRLIKCHPLHPGGYDPVR